MNSEKKINKTNGHIIVAEDDDAIAEVITIVLQDEGYTVHVVNEYEKIMINLIDLNCRLLLLDLGLSGHDGSVICKKIKETKDTQHIPVVILSANVEADDIAEKSGADDVLKKPFDIDDLLNVVRKYIGN